MALAISTIALAVLCLLSFLVSGARGSVSWRAALDNLPEAIVLLLATLSLLLLAQSFTLFSLLTAVTIVALALFAVSASRFSELKLPGRISWEGIALAILVLLALYVRRDPTNFVYMTGDMGEYVNVASLLARTGSIFESFPHLFTAVLAIPVLFAGPEATVGLMPLFGALSILVLVKILLDFGATRTTIAFTTSAASFGLMPIWFSMLPVSETLYGLLLLIAVAAVYKGLKTSDKTQIAVLATTVFLLGITRGNALVFYAVLVGSLYVVLVSGANPKWIAAMLVASTVGIFSAYLYNISYLPTYYLQNQLYPMLGETLVSFGQDINLFQVSYKLFVYFVLGIIGLLMPCVLFFSTSLRDRLVTLRVPILSAIVLLGTAAFMTYGSGALFDSLPAMGYVVLAMAAVCLFFLFVENEPAEIALIVVCLLTGLSSAMLFSYRLAELNNHAYFLYYQRYLFGDSYWSLIVLAGVGFHRLFSIQWLNKQVWIGVTLVAVGAAEAISASRNLWGRAIFEDSFAHVSAPVEQFSPGPKYFMGIGAGNAARPQFWFFPNMWRAYAFPLMNLYGIEFENINPNRPPFAPDPVLTLDGLEQMMVAKGYLEADLLIVNAPGEDAETNLWNQPEGSSDNLYWKQKHKDLEFIRLIPASVRPKEISFFKIPIESRLYRVYRSP
jgi:hypothetical protein